MRMTLWALRLLMAALLLFGSEILLWTDPLARSLSEWLLLVPGYIALGTLVLDLAARYRIHDVFDAMILAAVYGLCAALLLNPETALADFPHTLVTRVLGGHTSLGLAMFGFFLALTGGHIVRYRRLLLGWSLVLGVAWGIWVRWFPVLSTRASNEVSMVTMFLIAGVGLVIAALFWRIASGREEDAVSPIDLRLSPAAFGLLTVAMLALFLVRVEQEAIDPNVVPYLLLTLTLCMTVLWYQRTDKSSTLLDAHVPPTPLGWPWVLAALVIFGATAMLGYSLPLVEIAGYSQFSAIEFGFVMAGFLWLPVLAAAIGIRAYERQIRTTVP